MKSFFDKGIYEEVINRLDKLNENSKPLWGMMNSGQMVWHCQGPLNIILRHNIYNLKPNWFIKTFFKKSMYSNKLWRKNSPTLPQLKAKQSKDFTVEKKKLIALINELNNQKNNKNWEPHPVFGELTKEQWGKMQYKHLDHHLRQFGV